MATQASRPLVSAVLTLPLSSSGHVRAAGPGVGVRAHLHLFGGESAPGASGQPRLRPGLGWSGWWVMGRTPGFTHKSSEPTTVSSGFVVSPANIPISPRRQVPSDLSPWASSVGFYCTCVLHLGDDASTRAHRLHTWAVHWAAHLGETPGLHTWVAHPGDTVLDSTTPSAPAGLSLSPGDPLSWLSQSGTASFPNQPKLTGFVTMASKLIPVPPGTVPRIHSSCLSLPHPGLSPSGCDQSA